MSDSLDSSSLVGSIPQQPAVVVPIVSVPKAKRASSIDLTLDMAMDGADHQFHNDGMGWSNSHGDFDDELTSSGHGEFLRLLGGNNVAGSATLNHQQPLLNNHNPFHNRSPINNQSNAVDDLLKNLTPPLPPSTASHGLLGNRAGSSSGLFGPSEDDFLVGNTSVFSNNILSQHASPFASGSASLSANGISSFHDTPLLGGSSSAGLFEDRPLSGLGSNNSLNNNNNNNWPFMTDRSSLSQPRATSSLGFSMSSSNQNNLIASSITRPVSTPIYSSNLNGLNGGGLGTGGLRGQMDDMFAGLSGGFSQGQQHRQMSQGLPAMDSLLQGFNIRSNNSSRGLPALNQDSLGSHHQHLLGMNNNNGVGSGAAWPKPMRGNAGLGGGRGVFDLNLGVLDQHHEGSQPNSARIASPSPMLNGANPAGNMHTPNHLLHRRSNNNTPSNNNKTSHHLQGHHNTTHHNPHSITSMSPKISIQNMDDRAIESMVATSCGHILTDAADHSLKAVELANTLRARVGTEIMALVRERWGGLLTLLERHPDRFLVERIPKNDRVSLLIGNDGVPLQLTGANSSSVTDVHSSNNGEDVNDAAGDDSTAAIGQRISRPGTADIPENDSSVFHHDSFSHLRQNMSSSPSLANANGDDQQATRCLHVGNVPSSYTELQLAREFERFGQIEGLKLISHKNGNRRFAFITFKTISQAVTARHCLSKQHPWKSAISYAHREPGNGNGYTNYNNHAHNNHGNSLRGSNPHHSNSNNNMMLAGLMGRTPSPQHALGMLPPFQLFPEDSVDGTAAAPPTVPSVPTYSSIVAGNSNANGSTSVDVSLTTSDVLSASTTTDVAATLSLESLSIGNHSNHHSNSHHAMVTPSSSREVAVLQRLCDDTYVPTQPWPIDQEADQPFCRAVIDQISSFGGNTTISKLRGFLKHRVGTVDNIKSVPLKAMLMAYAHLFKVDGNFVSLVSTQA